MPTAKILVVEDEPAAAKGLRDCLVRLGYTVSAIVDSKEEAFRRVKHDSPDLVLMDAVLHGEMDGIKAAKHIRSCFTTPLILLTARSNKRLVELAKIPEVNSCIEKPFELKELQTTIETVLYKHTMEQQLSESEERFQKVYECSNDAILFIDPFHKKILDVNSRACKMLGFTQEELLLKQTSDLYPDSFPEYQTFAESVLEKGSGWTDKLSCRRKDGALVRVASSAAVLDFHGRTCILVMKRNVTEQKRLEDHVFQTKKMKSIGKLAGGIAHEFNNLLTPIVGHLELAIEQTPFQPEVQASLIAAEKAAMHAAALTKDLLSFGRQKPVDLQSLSLTTIVAEVEHLLSQTIDRRIKITIESVDHPWPVIIDTDQIHQVVMNLCLNARDALKEDLISQKNFQAVIRINLENIHLDETSSKSHPGGKLGDFLRLSVTDNGEGVDETDMPHLFEPFFTTKEPGQGTGLGLASSNGIIRQHGGWIEMKTDKGKGTTVSVYLPRTKQPVDSAIQAESEPPRLDHPATIMIVDDDELVRGFGRAVLERRGHKVISVEDGEQALEVFKQAHTRIEIVVLDLSMPGKLGWEVLHPLRGLNPKLKVIISTGHDISGMLEEKRDLEPFTILSKPFTIREMERAVLDALNQGGTS